MKTVGQLINELQALDPSLPVLQSRDPEGNGFHKFDEVGLHLIDPTELAEYWIESVTSEDEVRQYDDDPDEYTKVVVLWP